MATENNKNIAYTNKSDIFKKIKSVGDNSIKNDITQKIILFVNSIKTKHS